MNTNIKIFGEDKKKDLERSGKSYSLRASQIPLEAVEPEVSFQFPVPVIIPNNSDRLPETEPELLTEHESPNIPVSSPSDETFPWK